MPDTNPLPLPKQQGLIAAQIVVSVLFQLGFSVWAYANAGFAASPADQLDERIAFALQWNLLAAMVLLAMIGFIAGARPLSLDTIDGNDRAVQLERHVRVQRNTLEQLTLFAMGSLSFATIAPVVQLKMIPILAVLFVISRIVYWIGYVRTPLLRTLGFVATFYPNIAILLYTAWLLIH